MVKYRISNSHFHKLWEFPYLELKKNSVLLNFSFSHFKAGLQTSGPKSLVYLWCAWRKLAGELTLLLMGIMTSYVQDTYKPHALQRAGCKYCGKIALLLSLFNTPSPPCFLLEGSKKRKPVLLLCLLISL